MGYNYNFISDCQSPFSSECRSQNLVNIASGNEASMETRNFLLNVTEIGHQAATEFVERCLSDPKLFNEPISRQKVSTFALEGARVKKTRVDGKVQEIRMDRNMFGRLLMISLTDRTVSI